MLDQESHQSKGTGGGTQNGSHGVASGVQNSYLNTRLSVCCVPSVAGYLRFSKQEDSRWFCRNTPHNVHRGYFTERHPTREVTVTDSASAAGPLCLTRNPYCPGWRAVVNTDMQLHYATAWTQTTYVVGGSDCVVGGSDCTCPVFVWTALPSKIMATLQNLSVNLRHFKQTTPHSAEETALARSFWHPPCTPCY